MPHTLPQSAAAYLLSHELSQPTATIQHTITLGVTVGLPYQQKPQMYVLFLYQSEYMLL